MSWQVYVNVNMVGSGKIKNGCILGRDKSVWAKSDGFDLSAKEIENIVNAFDDSSHILGAGLFLKGEKYLVLRADDRSIYSKKGDCGACCVRTNQAVLVGQFQEPTKSGEANLVIENLADYLIGMDY